MSRLGDVVKEAGAWIDRHPELAKGAGYVALGVAIGVYFTRLFS